jgi:hypothetical protein
VIFFDLTIAEAERVSHEARLAKLERAAVVGAYARCPGCGGLGAPHDWPPEPPPYDVLVTLPAEELLRLHRESLRAPGYRCGGCDGAIPWGVEGGASAPNTSG